jgi:hypothetical protein
MNESTFRKYNCNTFIDLHSAYLSHAPSSHKKNIPVPPPTAAPSHSLGGHPPWLQVHASIIASTSVLGRGRTGVRTRGLKEGLRESHIITRADMSTTTSLTHLLLPTIALQSGKCWSKAHDPSERHVGSMSGKALVMAD